MKGVIAIILSALTAGCAVFPIMPPAPQQPSVVFHAMGRASLSAPSGRMMILVWDDYSVGSVDLFYQVQESRNLLNWFVLTNTFERRAPVIFSAAYGYHRVEVIDPNNRQTPK